MILEDEDDLTSDVNYIVNTKSNSMEVHPDNSNGGDGTSSTLVLKIAELQRKLAEGEDRYNLLQSQSELAKLVASQEVEKYKRECSSLRETVARLEEDCSILRERELKDQKIIKNLSEEIEAKQGEFTEKFIKLKVENRDLDCGRKRAQDKAHEWKKQYGEVEAKALRLYEENCHIKEKVEAQKSNGKERYELEARIRKVVEETFHLREKEKGNSFEKSRGEIASEVDEKLPKRTAEKGIENAKGKEQSNSIEKKRSGKLASEDDVKSPKREVDLILSPEPRRIVEENFHLVEKEEGGENAKGKEQSFEKSSGKLASEVRVLPKREVDLRSAPKSREKSVFVVVDSDNEGKRGGHGSDAEEDKILLSQLSKKRVREGDKKDSGSSLNHSSGCMTPSWTCSVSPQTSGFASNGAKEISADVEDVRIPSGLANNTQGESTKNPRSQKMFEWSDLSCSSKARNPSSTGHKNVAEKRARDFCKRNFKNQSSQRLYTGPIPSSEQLQRAEKRAEMLQRNLRSCNPSFIKTMGRSHVSGSFWLCLPMKFSKENLPDHEAKMILEDENGLENEVKYFCHSTAFSGGWRGFALDHNLKLGDVLIFELTEPARFKVYIIKAIPAEESCEDVTDGTNITANTNGNENQDVDLSDFQKKLPKAEHAKQTVREAGINLCDGHTLF